MRAMILAAGLGTRLKPLTEYKPKALVEIKGEPLLEIIIKKLIKHGFTDIIINVHHFAEQIFDFLKLRNNFNINIQISDESKTLLDTGGGIYHAKWFLEKSKSFLVYNVDIISDIDLGELSDIHNLSGALATLAVKKRDTSRLLLFDDNRKLCRWINVISNEEKIARKENGNLNPYAFSGIHMLSSDIFDLIDERKAFSIIDLYLRLARDYSIEYYDHNCTDWHDLGRYEHVMKYNRN